MNYYVYIVTVDGEIRYVGKGSKDRYKHAVSGASSVPQLNKDFFEGKEIVVYKFCYRETSEEAELAEREYISSLLYDGYDLYNKKVTSLPYLGDGYMDLFDRIPSAKALGGELIDIAEELRQETKREVLREIYEAKENM